MGLILTVIGARGPRQKLAFVIKVTVALLFFVITLKYSTVNNRSTCNVTAASLKDSVSIVSGGLYINAGLPSNDIG